MARGRKKKEVVLPESVEVLLDKVRTDLCKETFTEPEVEEVIDIEEFLPVPSEQEESSQQRLQRIINIHQRRDDRKWDVEIGDTVEYFDSNLSYEITGYKPINGESGLDFDPEWFMESRRLKESTGKYCSAYKNGKAYCEFWDREYERCQDGMTVNGYTITGDNYYFLNYYRLPNLSSATKAGAGRGIDFPNFYVKQYEYFHYIELCKQLRMNAIGLKARGVGFSEIGAAIAVNTYNARPNSRSVIAAQQKIYVDATLDKCWAQLNYLDSETEGGFMKLRQKHNTGDYKRASTVNTEGVESGWLSEIEGITADKPNKIRGDRTDYLCYEESGSWPNWKKAFIQGDALIDIQGQRFGIKCAWGTGGDSGPALEGLSAAYYEPWTYDALPYKHSYTADGLPVLTGYFIPAYTIVTSAKYVDKRGWTNPELGKKYYQSERDKKAGDPKGLMLYSAEYCFTAEEALALEGDNQFNTVLLSEQLAAIKLHKITPPEFKPKVGQLEYDFANHQHDESAKQGVRFIPNKNGKVVIIEHPIKSESGSDFRNLYVAGIDGIDMGQNDTSDKTRDPSDFCVVVKKRCFGIQEPMYVCIYKDRPNNLEEAYRTTLKILEYYNCKAVLESTRISILTWFRTKHKEDRYLMRRPRAVLSDIQAGMSKQFGAPATEAVIQHQLDLIDSFINDYYRNIWYEPMLNELITYSYENKRKFDIVAAMGMAELGDEELSGVPPKEVDGGGTILKSFGYWVDERGIRHKGVIPQEGPLVPKFNLFPTPYYDNSGVRTANPRYD